MGKKKSKKQEKREQRERRAAELAAIERVAYRRRRIMRAVVIAIPLVTIAAAVLTYVLTDEAQTAALVGLIGVGLWVPAVLGLVGGAVSPRDRTRAGSIDFGHRR
ncbi:MAG TPA: hypothetical protein VIL20_19590 [Sandaracinaceae bacterium]